MKNFLFLLFTVSCFGQQCVHKNLSKDFDISVAITRFGDKPLDETQVNITIQKKSGEGKAQEIEFVSESLFEESYTSCDAVMSHTTGVNKDLKVIDNDYGDIVVADLNFDSREDLAIKREEGGNGGPLYFFYLQNKDGLFETDDFLTDKVVYFPFVIDAKKKRLITLVHANDYQMNETVFELKGKKNWKEVSNRLVP